jgi:Histidinol phosphatase and related hydrolases of the PHP family
MNESKYRIIGDFHTHTVASQHAYGTIKEMVDISRERGLSAVAITDHGPEMLDGAIAHHFLCLNGLPEEVDGVFLYKGAEVNMKTFDGGLDLPPHILKNLDFNIASFHVEAITPGSVDNQTSALLHAAKNPYIDCLGHLGNPVFPFEHESVVKALKKIWEDNGNQRKLPHCKKRQP